MSSNSDDAFIERMEKQEAEMLQKFYGLKKTDPRCPKDAYLLSPDRLILDSYEVLGSNKLKLNIAYKKNWSGYVTETVRINYDQTILGSIICDGVENYSEVRYCRTGTIKIPFFSSFKVLNLPVKNSYNLQIKCKKITVESIAIFATQNGDLVPNADYISDISNQIRKGGLR